MPPAGFPEHVAPKQGFSRVSDAAGLPACRAWLWNGPRGSGSRRDSLVTPAGLEPASLNAVANRSSC